MTARLNAERGFDHGTFTVLAPFYPQADIPVVQLSLKAGLDPKTHIAASRLLAPLHDEGILIIGSGLSYHNRRQFDTWLQATLTQLTRDERRRRLVDWARAPAARIRPPTRRSPATAYGRRGGGIQRNGCMRVPRGRFLRRY